MAKCTLWAVKFLNRDKDCYVEVYPTEARAREEIMYNVNGGAIKSWALIQIEGNVVEEKFGCDEN